MEWVGGHLAGVAWWRWRCRGVLLVRQGHLLEERVLGLGISVRAGQGRRGRAGNR